MKIAVIYGTRPEPIKLAPVILRLAEEHLDEGDGERSRRNYAQFGRPLDSNIRRGIPAVKRCAA